MKLAVVGAGGREHALVWALAQASPDAALYCLPGNGGIADLARCVPVELGNVLALADALTTITPELTVVGPEMPLIAGLADELRARGLRVVGPGQAGARLEGSKIFAKEFMLRYGIPTASVYGIYDSPGEVYSALCAVDWPVVIKADGPCAGKGVLVAETPDEATAFVERLMERREFGSAGERVLLEEALEGRELSFIVLTDGQTAVPMVPVRDYKRALDGDQGPNTGGMGAISSAALLEPELAELIERNIVRPTLAGLAREGIAYCGFLYFGLMVTPTGPRVLEYNCRMGDPECQAIVRRLDMPLVELLEAAVEGRLAELRLRWGAPASACVVAASAGYPGPVVTGRPIEGLEAAAAQPGVVIFHAGTERDGQRFRTAGGRVLSVTATGATLAQAVERAYAGIGQIRFEGMTFRKDVGRH
jgi:phosphoribosylamine--glycine ligase